MGTTSEKKYNGWPNRSIWNQALWLKEVGAGWEDAAIESTKHLSRKEAAEALHAKLVETCGPRTGDGYLWSVRGAWCIVGGWEAAGLRAKAPRKRAKKAQKEYSPEGFQCLTVSENLPDSREWIRKDAVSVQEGYSPEGVKCLTADTLRVNVQEACRHFPCDTDYDTTTQTVAPKVTPPHPQTRCALVALLGAVSFGAFLVEKFLF